MEERGKELASEYRSLAISLTCLCSDSDCSADLENVFARCRPLIKQSQDCVVESYRHTLRVYTALERKREEIFTVYLSREIAEEEMLHAEIERKFEDKVNADALTPLQSRNDMRIAAHKNNFARMLDITEKKLQTQQRKTKELRMDYRTRTKAARLTRKQLRDDVALVLARISCLRVDIERLHEMLRAQSSD